MVFEFEGRKVIEGAVGAVGVVEGFDVVEGHEFGGGSGGWDGLAKAFGFERGHEAFGQGVVVGVAAAAHAGRDAMAIELLTKGAAGVLHATIAVI